VLHRQFTTSTGTFHLETGERIDNAIHVLGLVRLLLVSLIPIVIAIACAGGAWLSGQALKPVRDIADAAAAISIENLAGRLPVPETGDEIARLTAVLNSMLARLESAVRTLSQFVADASHELRTPLSVIRTTAELALRRPRSAESHHAALQEIAAETERMTQLVEDLLILARTDTGSVEMPLTPIDLRDVVSSVCSEVRRLAGLRNVDVHTSLGHQSITIPGNQAALHRLFLVLLDNALKYSAPGGKVNVILNPIESRVTVSIENFGPEISPEDLPHIFKRFYRSDRARTGDGYGLGLSLAESIARAHGATIDVRTGASTIFAVTFAFSQSSVSRRMLAV
jgi:signal transduction histidine kinase